MSEISESQKTLRLLMIHNDEMKNEIRSPLNQCFMLYAIVARPENSNGSQRHRFMALCLKAGEFCVCVCEGAGGGRETQASKQSLPSYEYE